MKGILLLYNFRAFWHETKNYISTIIKPPHHRRDNYGMEKTRGIGLGAEQS